MDNLLIVGIGSSAGGLEPLIELLTDASCHKSMCFVAVPHVPRFQKNDLPSILERFSGLNAVEIKDGIVPKPCTLYTIPPNAYVTLSNGAFKVSPRPEDVPNNSADAFFESLAVESKSNAIGVVLSGAKVGEDGAKGVTAIKHGGGHTYAQEPNEAKFPDMPLAAIATGNVDSVLPAAQIGNELSLLSWVAGHAKDKK